MTNRVSRNDTLERKLATTLLDKATQRNYAREMEEQWTINYPSRYADS
ncbi:hypothetical protein [Photobacterium lutimaris]|nr:hypothetical protein [Photobacterium lutimaris]